MDVRDIEREEGRTDGADWRASRDRRERLAESDQGYENAAVPQPGKPWGFFLVLAAIVVVALMYSVTMVVLSNKDLAPATAIGALSGAFAVIGTLVGTYFGIKAGLDGQEKLRDTMRRSRNGEVPPRYRPRREDE